MFSNQISLIKFLLILWIKVDHIIIKTLCFDAWCFFSLGFELCVRQKWRKFVDSLGNSVFLRFFSFFPPCLRFSYSAGRFLPLAYIVWRSRYINYAASESHLHVNHVSPAGARLYGGAFWFYCAIRCAYVRLRSFCPRGEWSYAHTHLFPVCTRGAMHVCVSRNPRWRKQYHWSCEYRIPQ